MKKVLSVAIVLVMLFALSVSVFADDAVAEVEQPTETEEPVEAASGETEGAIDAEKTANSPNTNDPTADSHDTDVTTPSTSTDDDNGYTDSPASGSDVTTPSDGYTDSPASDIDVTAANVEDKVEEGTETVKLADGTTATVELTATESLESTQKSSLKKAVAALDQEGVAAEVIDVDLIAKDGSNVTEEYFKGSDSLTVVFVRDDNAAVVGVLYWNAETQTWDQAEFEQHGQQVTATFEHLCSVVFLTNGIYTEEVPIDPPSEDTNGGNGSYTDSPASGSDVNTPSGYVSSPANGGDVTTPSGYVSSPASGSDITTPATNVSGTNTNGGSTAKGGNSPQTGYNTVIWVSVAVVLALAAGVCFVSARKKVEE